MLGLVRFPVSLSTRRALNDARNLIASKRFFRISAACFIISWIVCDASLAAMKRWRRFAGSTMTAKTTDRIMLRKTRARRVQKVIT